MFCFQVGDSQSNDQVLLQSRSPCSRLSCTTILGQMNLHVGCGTPLEKHFIAKRRVFYDLEGLSQQIFKLVGKYRMAQPLHWQIGMEPPLNSIISDGPDISLYAKENV